MENKRREIYYDNHGSKKGQSLFDKRIILFLISQNISIFGSAVVEFAIIWYITLETSSGTWLMLSTICSMVPHIFVSLWGGVWADRYNRKHLIMLADTFIALATLGIAIAFWSGFRHMGLLLAVSVVRSVGAGIQIPAVNAIYPQLVPKANLTKIQGVNQTLYSLLMLLAPAVGGMLLATVDIAWAFMVDVVSAAFAVLIMGFIKVEKLERTDEKESVLADLKQGIDYAFRHPLLRGIIICYAFSFFLITPASVLTPLLIERSYGGEVWKLTANEVFWTIGSLIGGVFVSLYGDFKDKVGAIAKGFVAHGITFVLLGLARNFTFYLIVMGTSGFFMPIVATAETVLIQEITEPTMLGRVFSIVHIIAASSMPVAILIFGPLADVVSVEKILSVSGALLVLVGIIYHRSSRGAIQALDISHHKIYNK